MDCRVGFFERIYLIFVCFKLIKCLVVVLLLVKLFDWMVVKGKLWIFLFKIMIGKFIKVNLNNKLR